MDLDIKQFVFRKGATSGIPVSGTFELTPRCNFRCKMCYVQMSPEEQRSAGRELTTREWFDIARKAVEQGMIYLLLTGGEPLLRPDFSELYSRLIQMGIVVSVNTNGSLITPEIVDCFRRFPPERVNITLYGASSSRYQSMCGNEAGYEKTMQSIRMLKQAGIRVNLNTTFIRENRVDMETLVHFAEQENIPIRTAAYLFPPVRNEHGEMDRIMSAEEQGIACAEFDFMTMNEEQKIERLRAIRACLNDTSAMEETPEVQPASCMAGRGAFWVSWNGRMYACGMLSHEGTDVLEFGFSEAWSKTKEGAKKLCLPGECSVCKLRKLCPSCAAVSQCVNQEQGKLVENLCVRTRVYVRHFLKLFNTKL